MSLVAVLILLAAHTAPATAQQKAQTVSGTVLDPDGNPLIGATVVVVKGTQGAVTERTGTSLMSFILTVATEPVRSFLATWP